MMGADIALVWGIVYSLFHVLVRRVILECAVHCLQHFGLSEVLRERDVMERACGEDRFGEVTCAAATERGDVVTCTWKAWIHEDCSVEVTWELRRPAALVFASRKVLGFAYSFNWQKKGFLHKGLTEESARTFRSPRAERQLLECCAEDANHRGECKHARRFYEKAFPESANPCADLVELMCELYKHRETCDALREWHLALADTVAREAEHGLRRQLSRDGFSGDFAGRRSRMRVDQDYKAVVTARVMAGKASSIRQYLRAQGNEWLSGMTGDDWQSLELQRLLLSIKQQATNERQGFVSFCGFGA
eukprot:4696228-Amphidinium_carterae.1